VWFAVLNGEEKNSWYASKIVSLALLRRSFVLLLWMQAFAFRQIPLMALYKREIAWLHEQFLKPSLKAAESLNKSKSELSELKKTVAY
jgi:hypothetical protein